MAADAVGETLYMKIGETKIIKLTVLESDGETPAVLTGATAKFSFKGLETPKECTIEDNVITAIILPTDTTKVTSVPYEFRIIDSFDQVDSLVVGILKVEYAVITDMGA